MIQIRVFLNFEAKQSNSRVLERRVNWDFSVRFPVDETLLVMKAMFGKSALVEFLYE